MVAAGRSKGYKSVFVPNTNAREASLVDDPDYEFEDPDEGRLPNLADVRGQEHAKRALDSPFINQGGILTISGRLAEALTCRTSSLE